MQLNGEPSISSTAPAMQPYRSAFTINTLTSARICPPSSMIIRAPHQGRFGPISVGLCIIQSEGVAALISGVSVTILRQTLYSTKLVDPETGNLPLVHKIVAGLIAGGIGAVIGNPADVAMVRMQADGRVPIDQSRSYKSVIDALSQMAKQEGIWSQWRGSSLTMNRAMIVTASQFASYDQIKEVMLEKGVMRDGIGIHVTASFLAALVAAVISNPIDVIKTRVMNMKVEPGAVPPYMGALDCAMKMVRSEGPTAVYKGFTLTVSRQGPFTVVLFVTLEQVRKLLQDLQF
ncbi:hypothetical protein K2173_009143 [Erythroxylum novogranatense]|uniref:Uncharacterized protein n=1 Tax=Erythroxylum novogranatense TaxID=1862640 RepID=A0AAV8TF01_9ROSI|nr:hypothetical protein K2173_009143 [Erythroxylum novogranatense]